MLRFVQAVQALGHARSHRPSGRRGTADPCVPDPRTLVHIGSPEEFERVLCTSPSARTANERAPKRGCLGGTHGAGHRRRGLHRQHAGRPAAPRGRGVRAFVHYKPYGERGWLAGAGGRRRHPGGRRPRRGPRAHGGRGLRRRLPPGRAHRHPLQLRRARELRADERDGNPERRRRLPEGGRGPHGAHLDERDLRHRACGCRSTRTIRCNRNRRTRRRRSVRT